MKKVYYVMNYSNGNKAIIEKSEYEKEMREEYGIDTTVPGYHDEAIVGVVESETEPTWNDLIYNSETGEYILHSEGEEIKMKKIIAEVYEAICDVAKSNTDFDIGFDYLFGFMEENPDSETTKGFIEYHLEEMHAPTTADGKPEFTYLIGRDFVAEHWVSEEDMATFNEYLKKMV